MKSLIKLTLAFALACSLAIGVGVGAVAQDDGYKDAPHHEWTPGPAEQLSQLDFLLGKWDVAIEIKNEYQPEQHYKGTSQVIELLDGVAFQESLTIKIEDKNMSMLTVFAYDRQKDVFRVTRLDSSMGMLDVMEGNFDEYGKLVITNENNGTALKNYETGESMFARLTLNKLSESKFEIAWEMSKDEGKTWHGVGHMTYTRAA